MSESVGHHVILSAFISEYSFIVESFNNAFSCSRRNTCSQKMHGGFFYDLPISGPLFSVKPNTPFITGIAGSKLAI